MGRERSREKRRERRRERKRLRVNKFGIFKRVKNIRNGQK